jgi:cell wall-associated NlpC family hydrolase
MMIKKIAILLTLTIMLTFSIPEAASASTYNNGLSWRYESNDIISYGNTLLGTPYLFGAKYGRTDRFDCSSFVKFIYRNYITLPRSSREQAKAGSWISINKLRKGDLVFFKSTGGSSRISHVAIYAGSGKLLHTYGSGGVKYTNFSSYWKGRYVTARRVLR